MQEIEVSASLSPERVPPPPDPQEGFARTGRRQGTLYAALVPNERGLTRALRARIGKAAVFTAASETFNRRNVNASIAESIERFKPVVEGARGASIPVRGYVSTAFWCPYEGKVAPEAVVDVVNRLTDLGVDEISIGDTIGKAVPAEVMALLDLLLDHVDQDRLVMHFHDTYGTAIANVPASYERGIPAFDSSAGGVGGCLRREPRERGHRDVIWALTRSGATVAPPRSCAHRFRSSRVGAGAILHSGSRRSPERPQSP
jgi:hydroxymethylglutaryl-CoA lyase